MSQYYNIEIKEMYWKTIEQAAGIAIGIDFLTLIQVFYAQDLIKTITNKLLE